MQRLRFDRFHTAALLLTAGLGVMFSGCPTALLVDVTSGSSESKSVATVEEEVVPSAADFAGQSPEELSTAIESAQQNADQVAQMLTSGINYELRLQEFARHIQSGAAAADALAQHEDATDQQVSNAQLAQIKLLYTGAKSDAATFKPVLTAAVEKLHEEQSELAVVGEAMLVEISIVSADDVGHEEVLKSLGEFARRHRGHPAGAALFVQYGEQLEKDDEFEKAMECYRTAVGLFPNAPQLAAVRSRLAKYDAANRARLAKERAKQAKLAAIKRKLGFRDGYFVLYWHEPNKLMYRFDYEVLQGVDTAAERISRLSDKYEWEIVSRFPDTPQGSKQAEALRSERVKKETAYTVPVYGY